MDDSSVWHSALRDVDLTARQLEVLRLKADRRTNAEIAEKLVITVTTVKWHVRQIYNKLGANNRAEAVASARQLGLLEKRSERRKGALHNFPTPLTHFVGRKHDIQKILGALTDSDTHLLTLLGPGGIGKTRLAMQVTKSLEADFPDGICWVPFSALDQAELVFTTIDEYIAENIYTAFGLTRQGKQEYTQLLESYLKERQALVVLDSFESLIFGASFISDLLAKTSACKFLITSRERLNLPGEVLISVLGLAHTHEAEGGHSPTDAARLFLQEANRVSQSNLDHPDHLPSIQRICTRLEGMPLAITLAAEWSRLLPVETIEQELEHGLEFLDTGSTSIRAVFDRSWNLLTDQQQAAFARLAVFQRGFSREAAKKVVGADLDTLSALFDKSLIQKREGDRYTLHDLLRQYAGEHLNALGERDAVRDIHCAFFAALVDKQEDAIISGDHSKILADLDNIRAAWRWAVKRKRLTDLNCMMFPLNWFYNLQTHYAEAMAAMQQVIDHFQMSDPGGLQGIVYGQALANYGLQRRWIHGANDATPVTLKGLDILRSLGAKKDLAWPLILTAFYQLVWHNTRLREQFCLESLKIFEELDLPRGITFSLVVLGTHYIYAGQYKEAQITLERALSISRSNGDLGGKAFALHYMGDLNLSLGEFETARQYFFEEAAIWTQLSQPRKITQTRRSIGLTCLGEEKFKEAESYYLETLAEFEEMGDPGNIFDSLITLGQIALIRNRPLRTLDLLQDAAPILETYRDDSSQADQWLLSGRVSLQLGDADTALNAICHALHLHRRITDRLLLEAFLDLAHYYHHQSKNKHAARLLGFVQSRVRMTTILVQKRIAPLQASLFETIGEEQLAELLKEGAALNQQELINRLLADCG